MLTAAEREMLVCARDALSRTRDDIDDILSPAPAEPERGEVELKDVGVQSYFVRPGDSLWSIAAQHEVEWADLLAWNDLDKNAVIYPGMEIRLGSGAAIIGYQGEWSSPVDPSCGDLIPPAWLSAINHGQIYEYPPSHKGQTHTGCDLNRRDRQDYRAPVHAVADGTVTYSGYSPSWGNVIVINHGDTSSRYAHLFNRDRFVGEPVKRGQRIGLIGDGGGRFDPHLHFDMAQSSLFTGEPLHWAGKTLDKFSQYIDPELIIQGG